MSRIIQPAIPAITPQSQNVVISKPAVAALTPAEVSQDGVQKPVPALAEHEEP
jgi:hypothetical protein